MIEKSNLKYHNENLEEDNEVDLRHLINTLIRNKFFILKISILFFVLACLYGIFKKKIWIGEFDIVIKTTNNNQESLLKRFSGNSNLSNLPLNLLNIGGNNDIKTEVGILESSSILLPTFNYVNEQRKLKKPKIKDLVFSDWKKKQLKIKLKKNTSILNISYKDPDKRIINQVLNNIANDYQDYSGRNKSRTFQLTREYLNDQISIYKIKSKESFRFAQNFAIDNDLVFPMEIAEGSLQNNILAGNIGNVDIELVRVNATNRITKNEKLIEKIESYSDRSENIQIIVSQLMKLDNSQLMQNLENIEAKIAKFEVKYTQNDPALKRLKEEKNALINALREKSIAFLRSNIIEDESLLEAATRPKETLLEFKDIMRTLKRDEKTLVNLENELRMLNLQESKTEDPWELITKPTIKDVPFSPKKKILALQGLFIGFFLSIFVSIFKEKKSGIIYEEDILEKTFNAEIIKKYSINDRKFFEGQNQISVEEIVKKYNNFNILFTSNIENNFVNKIIEYLEMIIKKSKVNTKINIFTNNLSEDENFKSLFLFIKLDNLNKDDLNNLKRRIDFHNIKVQGIFLLV